MSEETNTADVQASREATPSDLADAAELIAAATQQDGIPPVSDHAQLAARTGARRLTVFRRAGEAVAVGIVGDGELDLVVDPAVRGQRIGRAAFDDLLHTTEGDLKAWVHGDRPAAEHLLVDAGFVPVRGLHFMSLDPALLPGGERTDGDTAPAHVPEGFTLLRFDPADPSHADMVLEVNRAAFAAHPEQGALDLGGFVGLTAEAWFDPLDLLLLCEKTTGQPVAFSWIKTTTADGDTPGEAVDSAAERPVETELYVLGVHPAHAGRGLGSAMLRITLQRMAEAHPARVTLYVDDDNAQALALYRRFGFTTARFSQQWLGHGTGGKVTSP